MFNDLTKVHQRIYRGKTSNVLEELNNNPNSEKGEYVLIIKYKEDNKKVNIDISSEAILIDTMVKNNCTLKDAINICKDNYKLSKNDLYNASLNIKKLI